MHSHARPWRILTTAFALILSVAALACTDTSTAPAGVRAPGVAQAPTPLLVLGAPDVAETETNINCPTTGQFWIYSQGGAYGPFTISPLWNNCRDFNTTEKVVFNELVYPALFNNTECRDVAMELYAMINSNPPRMRVAQGEPHFPYPYQDVVLNASTHPPRQTMTLEPLAFVSEDRVMSAFPGTGTITLIHEAFHSYSIKNGLGLTEADVQLASNWCWNNS
jgi:hypothetical protein